MLVEHRIYCKGVEQNRVTKHIKSAWTDYLSVDEEKADTKSLCRIEIFGGYLPVVTIVRNKAKTAGDCRTN